MPQSDAQKMVEKKSTIFYMPGILTSVTVFKDPKQDGNKLGDLWSSNCEGVPSHANSIEIRLAENVNAVGKQTLHQSKVSIMLAVVG